MNLKKKKQLGSILIAISLATTGCGTISREEATSAVEKMMDESNFYQSDFVDENNEEYYGKFYNTYLNNFIDYMSKEQYKEFKNMVTDVERIDRFDYISLVNCLQNILCDGQEKGVGIYAAFNTELLYEELNQTSHLDDRNNRHINTLKCLVNDDEAFYKSLFSKDIDDFKKVIVEKTNASDEDVSELIDLFDEYYVLVSSFHSKKEYEELENKIIETMRNIISAKIESNPNFSYTLYGRMLRSSIYFGPDYIWITKNLVGDKTFLTSKDYFKGDVTFEFDQKYLFSQDIELWELKYLVANSYIEEAYERYRDPNYDSTGMELISILLSEKCTLENASNAEEIRCELYKDLGDYFDSSDDFADFLIRLFNREEYALNRYFEIFKKRISEDGISMLDFLRYESLRNLIKKYEYNSYFFENNNYYTTYDDLRSLPKENAEEIASVFRTNYKFDVDYDKYFSEIDTILANNDLGVSRVINENASFNWWERPITINEATISAVLISEPAELKERELDGVTLYYYEAPRGFEEGTLSEVFYNIDGNLVTREFPGVEAVIEDPDTKEDKFVTVISINKRPYLPDQDLKFVNPYPIYSYDYNATEEEKKLLR